MEKWGKERPRRGHEYPSFSSTLLDAIYRSIDESDAVGVAKPSPIAAAPRQPAPAYHSAAAAKERVVTRPRGLPPISTSSSSDNSSYGGFSSSSEPESAANHSARMRPIRTVSVAPARSVSHPPPSPPLSQRRVPSSPAAHNREKTKSSSIRSKLRDLGRSKPASPGARLAGLLNSLFATAAGKPRRPKSSPAPTTVDDSACSTASSYSRSCFVKTPSSRRGLPLEEEGVKRSVRFHPVSVIVGEDLRPCGQKIVCAGDRSAAEAKDKRRRSVAVPEGKEREETRRRVEELLRRYEDEEEEDEDEMSDSSSDLFELENLTVMGGGYRNELPVYETTHPGTYRAISRGLVQ
ncbi:protein BIG GRAIN 1-like [Canna indica]|uniref:Protein BIG GRAIN 1-like n=1 Tax=Canna indica TaxID=4628 RepID=A0AAQ3JNA2_9LILI|nr:protein BIG GRAIN 1-like [Canna indica]